ncbi:helix-turn-helix domain-containing protein [Acidimicrobiia bacterium EGI L10123]|uniref:helix-turn-helix domain-containing protein n=1 Tax=Salinilacustrithrix flava TaxID=2957203 RepID=UPI003D7C1EFB|nr:helix-turn-helix domain-containing protein [Acidimicrobiia bacterium EGI L10123]
MDLDDAARKQLESLGGFIRERRKQAQYSLRDLADRANVSNPYLSQIERGLHTPSVRVLKAIAAALNVSAESLLVQAGLLEASDEGERGPSVEDAIRADSLLSEDQKAAMLAVYRSYVARNTAEDD